jgi:hypothetical protein
MTGEAQKNEYLTANLDTREYSALMFSERMETIQGSFDVY